MSVNVEDARIYQKAEELLNGCGLVLPAAGATKTSQQVASLTAFISGTSDTPYNVTSHQRKVGTEIKCDSEDIGILAEYLQWICKTKKCLNISQLIAIQIPNDAGKKPISRHKGAPRKKKLLERKNHRQMILIRGSGIGPADPATAGPKIHYK